MTAVEIMIMGIRCAGGGGDHATGTGGNTLRAPNQQVESNILNEILMTELEKEGEISKMTKQKKY